MGNIIRPNYSSAEVAARAASLKFEARRETDKAPIQQFDVSWLPRLTVPNSASSLNDDKTLDLHPLIYTPIECQECLVYLSKCYCDKSAA